VISSIEANSQRIVGNVEDVIKKPHIVYVNKFTEATAKQFYLDFEKAHSSGQEIIPIVIDSYGGAVDSLMLMIDVIQQSAIPVATICLGKAMSCGAFLLSCGKEGYRFAGPNSRIMIHHVSAATWGKVLDMDVSIEETKRLQNVVFKLMDKNCKKKEGYFLKKLKEKDNTDWYLTPEEALSHNLINEIKIPHFKTSVEVVSELV